MSPIRTFRNPILSLWQSAIHKVVSKSDKLATMRLSSNYLMMTQFVTAADALTNAQPMPRVDAFGNNIGECAELIAKRAWAEITGNTQRVIELTNEIKMSSDCDLGWREVLEVYLEFRAKSGFIPYIHHTNLNDFVLPLPDKPNLLVAFIADWGTGIEDAQHLLSQVMLQRPDVLIHLGDIYYSGTMDEVRDNFLNICWATAVNSPIYILSGNHDMYSGGAGYYWLIQQLNQYQPKQYQQPASYFCLRNKNWQFLAMDTGLHDCNPFTVGSNVTCLDPPEVEWHLDKIKNAPQGIKTVLLSHHQLFSAVGGGVGKDKQGNHIAFNPHLQSSFASVLDNVALWLWGHEHNLVVFDPYINLNKGRCIGSGAIPVMIQDSPYTPNQNFDLQGQSGPPVMNQGAKLSSNKDGFYYHAYAIVTLNDGIADVDYYQVDSINNGISQHLFSERLA